MCGICGIVDLSGPGPSEPDLLALRDDLAHRGPDDAGLHREPGVGLGACRLAIQDLSARGHMPMPNEDETLWITYNGEVYNFETLRAQLEERGHRFRSGSDTEVVLHAYQEWGDACPERLSGMFAFAVWDRKRRRIFAARDRLGVKPFFYLQRGAQLVFASEVHALYRFAPPDPENLDPVALDFFLSQGFPPPDRSFVQGLAALPPAHSLVFDEAGLRLSRYWDLRFRPARNLSREDALEELDRVLRDAVERRLRSDVPLGCFLSGGIDSGLVTAMTARASAESVSSFSLGFAGDPRDEDERPLARLVAERYGTRHREIEVRPDHRALLTSALWHVGEPFADVGLLPMVEISRAAREHVVVALSGDGGDES
ncbi:MAG: asparagine synthase (glutamine-hydrolyzing), partial [Proteobacteria bacterium]|nr:asparagine synthase (glutamine-hydrolyzing) [Pseudomonadota bacterium]